MEKEDLLKQIAEKGYDVGFGAKKHLATYDIICKAPGWISFLSIAIGIIALATEFELNSLSSALLIIFGISALYIEPYRNHKEEYEAVGKKLTGYFHDLKGLCARVEHDASGSLGGYINELKDIDREFQGVAISKQIFISDAYAHYKFFWQMQTSWIEQYRSFSFWRDKIPLSAYVACVLILMSLLAILFEVC
ncbi:SLATT domain-containing protein [Halomonas piscis]|uniref:SLATT domain-containing protein n=1 Tax=Halomonas piscis TaxID=3031727 RepID=A0ABY9YW35_9GAMM|nr:SLATT domain-containing protein [Halomonas piscis]WNK19036.1 SLATT domain-containing protein [Halomonas piscis]